MKLTNPTLVARDGDDYLIASGDYRQNSMTDSQLWSRERGYSDVKPLQVWFKWLPYLEEVNPRPWVEPAP
jgi:hypothetical protein